MHKKFVLTSFLVGLLAVVTIGALVYFARHSQKKVTDYESCVAAGYPVQESYPARCLGPNGRTYIQTESSGPTSFDECANLGYPIQESYPRRCSTADGRSFTESRDELRAGDVTTLSDDLYYAREKAGHIIINNEADYKKLWEDLAERSNRTDLKRPKVDFDKQVIIGVFAGAQSGGGHSIRVTSVTGQDYRYKVHLEKTWPGDNCTTTTVVTYPYHIVAYAYAIAPAESTSKADWRLPVAKDFQFVTNTRVNSCYAD